MCLSMCVVCVWIHSLCLHTQCHDMVLVFTLTSQAAVPGPPQERRKTLMVQVLLHLSSIASCTAHSQLTATSASDVQQRATLYFILSLATVIRRSRSRLCQPTAPGNPPTERSPGYQQVHQLGWILAWPLQMKHC